MATAPRLPADGEERCCKALRARARWLEHAMLPHEAWLRAWVARRFPAEIDHDDIVQECFEKVLRFADPLAVRNPRVYLSRTATALVIDRARRRRIVRIDYHDDLGELGLVCAYPLPDAICAAREEWDAACRALAALPERTQKVVALRRIEEVPQRAVAAAMALSESAIEKHVRRGVRAVRAELENAG